MYLISGIAVSDIAVLSFVNTPTRTRADKPCVICKRYKFFQL